MGERDVWVGRAVVHDFLGVLIDDFVGMGGLERASGRLIEIVQVKVGVTCWVEGLDDCAVRGGWDCCFGC